MPYKKAYKKRFVKRKAKRTFVKKKRAPGRRTVLCREIGGFPDRYFAKFRFATTVSHQFGAVQEVEFNIKANSVRLPDGSGAVSGVGSLLGAAAAASTQKSPYTQFIVHGMKMTLIPQITVGATTGLFYTLSTMPLPVGQTSYTGAYTNIWENPDAKQITSNGSLTGDSFSRKSLTMYTSNKSRLGLKGDSDLTNLTGNSGADPTWLYYININGAISNATDATFTVLIRVECEYYVEFFLRNTSYVSVPAVTHPSTGVVRPIVDEIKESYIPVVKPTCTVT